MSDKLSVSAIKNGTVIDHITPGQAFRIAHLLHLSTSKQKITLGVHLPSKRLGSKDIIKIENRIISDDEANEIVIFAPDATINVIENFNVIKKISTRFPSVIKHVFSCPNHSCITQVEHIPSYFHLQPQGKQFVLRCHYCEKPYHRDQLKVLI